MADQYYRQRLMSKCLVAWQLFVSQQLSHRVIEEDNQKTKNKMAAFLEAAASGKMWTERKSDNDRPQPTVSKKPGTDQLDALFKQSAKAKGTFSLNSTARSDIVGTKSSKKIDTPHEPWQITRKHLQLTKKQIASMGQAPGDGSTCTCHDNNNSKTATPTSHPHKDRLNHPLCLHCSEKRENPSCSNTENNGDTARSKTTPWTKGPFSVNNFEHRHAAQQKILETQQKQIKEQQKLIEELQYLQKQQMLQQQLLQQENVKRQLAGGAGGGGHDADTIQNTLTHLQEHIQRLQQQLMSGTTPLQHCAPEDLAELASNGHNTHNVQHTERSGNVLDIELRDIEDEADSNTLTGDLSTAKTGSSLRLDLSSVENVGVTNTKGVKGSTADDGKTSAGDQTAKSSAAKLSKVVSSSRSNATSTTSSKTGANHPMHTEFLKKMEDRAAERNRIKQDRELKKQREEEERMAQLIAQEAEVRRAEEEDKRKRLDAHRLKKKLDKQRELEKQQFTERMKALTLEADMYCARASLRFRGWLPWRKLIQILRDKEELARQHYTRSLQRTCLLSWRQMVAQEQREKNNMADQFHTYLVIKEAFSHWCKIKEASVIQEQKAARHYEIKVQVKVLKIWADYAAEEKVSMWHKERIAKEHNVERIRKKYFRLLQQFPIIRKEEELREHRRQQLRKKVANLLPDFRASQNENG